MNGLRAPIPPMLPLPPPHRLCVAPMMERTDRHCRYLLRLLAPHAWLYTEMITARALVNGDRERLLRFNGVEHPVALQLGGSEPDELAAAAAWGEEAGYDEINLNVGCPSGRVSAGCFGAALMLDAPRVADCVVAMRSAVSVPVTVKTRLGVDDSDDYAFLRGFADAVLAAGCRTLVVHARKAWLRGLSPKQNREVPPLDYSRVSRLKRDFPDTEIVVNGGLTDHATVRAQLTSVDGVMIGRGAYHEPMFLAALDRALFDAADTAAPVGAAFSRDLASATPHVSRARVRALDTYSEYIERELENGTPLRAMTRHLMGLFAHERGGRRWRRELSLLPDGMRGLGRLRALTVEQGARALHEVDAEPATMTALISHYSEAR